MNIGSIAASGGNYIFPNEEITSDNVLLGESCANEDVLLDKIYKKSHAGTFDLDEIMVSVIYAGRHQCVKAKDLAKIWRMDEQTAREILCITTHKS